MEIEELKEHLEKLSIEELHDIKNSVIDIIKNTKVGDVPIGETFKFFGKEYIVKKETPNIYCDNCTFKNKSYEQTCEYLCCLNKDRHDGQNVIFVEKKIINYD